jgi:hypothetical protein
MDAPCNASATALDWALRLGSDPLGFKIEAFCKQECGFASRRGRRSNFLPCRSAARNLLPLDTAQLWWWSQGSSFRGS